MRDPYRQVRDRPHAGGGMMDVLELHRFLVERPSVSGNEAAVADFVQGVLCTTGADVERRDNNVIARAGRGPRLLLNSHLDTVPAGVGWDRDPWTPTVEGGRIYGLGSNDAKASVAAMMSAFMNVAGAGGPCEVVLMLCQEEETGGAGTEAVWPWLRDEREWVPEGVVVGEPTGLEIGVAQRGLVIFELVALGDQCHAANADSLGARNPVWQLAEDIATLKHWQPEVEDPFLGPVSIQPTKLLGADAKNQVPAEARATFDVRTVPGCDHMALLGEVQRRVKSEVRAVSTRFAPYACPIAARILVAAKDARPASQTFGSSTLSDQAHFRDVPAVKCGPGLSARSHTPNEFVMEEEVLQGAEFYTRLISRFAEVAV
ncbi:MAG: M20/M25/M40 family metallo-hydrolase [Armatimonadetes bacterium]|nr:M20/M25/M40 family metallo-hydrolase [Armatimonadota bacterium]